MKVGIDSYCYHRFFGEVYPDQKTTCKENDHAGFSETRQGTESRRGFSRIHVSSHPLTWVG